MARCSQGIVVALRMYGSRRSSSQWGDEDRAGETPTASKRNSAQHAPRRAGKRREPPRGGRRGDPQRERHPQAASSAAPARGGGRRGRSERPGAAPREPSRSAREHRSKRETEQAALDCIVPDLSALRAERSTLNPQLSLIDSRSCLGSGGCSGLIDDGSGPSTGSRSAR